jgi:Ca2+-transporting ATPase
VILCLVLLMIGAVISLVIGIYEDYASEHPDDEPRVGWVEGK